MSPKSTTMDNQMHPVLASFLSGTALFAAIGALVNVLPAISTALGIIWFTLMIIESRPVAKWIREHRRRRILRLRRELAVLEKVEREGALETHEAD